MTQTEPLDKELSNPDNPLSATDIKVVILQRGDTLAGMARMWDEERPELHINEQVLSRVIHRRAPYVYPEVRQLLADYLGVDVSRVGREPSKEIAPEEEPVAATA
jgi:hypothetical protein